MAARARARRSDEDTLAAAVDAHPSSADAVLADEERRVLAEQILSRFATTVARTAPGAAFAAALTFAAPAASATVVAASSTKAPGEVVAKATLRSSAPSPAGSAS